MSIRKQIENDADDPYRVDASPRRKRNPSRMGGGRTQAPDEASAKELLLFATNDADLYRRRILHVLANLARKIKRGIYKRGLAVKLWRHVADDAAQRYTKQFGTIPAGKRNSFGIFDKPTRELTAEWLAIDYEEELEGEAVELGVPVEDVMRQMGEPSIHRHPFYNANPAKRGEYVITVKGRRKKFATEEDALRAANEYHRATGIFVGVEHSPISVIKSRYYVGYRDGAKEIFSHDTIPTQESHPRFNAVIGPFRTKKAALLMAQTGARYETVANAERAARKRNPAKRSSGPESVVLLAKIGGAIRAYSQWGDEHSDSSIDDSDVWLWWGGNALAEARKDAKKISAETGRKWTAYPWSKAIAVINKFKADQDAKARKPGKRSKPYREPDLYRLTFRDGERSEGLYQLDEAIEELESGNAKWVTLADGSGSRKRLTLKDLAPKSNPIGPLRGQPGSKFYVIGCRFSGKRRTYYKATMSRDGRADAVPMNGRGRFARFNTAADAKIIADHVEAQSNLDQPKGVRYVFGVVSTDVSLRDAMRWIGGPKMRSVV